ncbi:hypothetical protein LTS08_007504 [Lithohypha guttulata]|nr:hypothetical protein LTS08_007504 [Lithohypha guttulata]
MSCEAKTIKKTGESMLVVGVEKEFRDSQDNLCVLDKRNWVFREALDPSKQAKIPEKPAELTQSQLADQAKDMVVREFHRDQVQLFRIIHYDLPWARDVEGHRNVVVHGPLNQISILDFWRDEMVKQGKHEDGVVYPKELFYRATSPVYAGEPYRILMPKPLPEQQDADVQVMSNDGTICMKATVHNS